MSKRKIHHIKAPHFNYPLVLERDLLKSLGGYLRDYKVSRAILISNTTLKKLYESKLERLMKRSGVQVLPIWLPDGEQYKNLNSISSIYDKALKWGVDRQTAVIAFGGGVVGDMAGFISATLLRGLPLIQIPTSLVAMVDSSIGGKTGVDHRTGKNLIGSFYQPKIVLIDPDLLKTLPKRQIQCGMAEVIKYAMIRDSSLLRLLEKNVGKIGDMHQNSLDEVIWRCAVHKAKVVVADEREGGLRSILNFGHTLGHAWERLAGFKGLHHGEAVGFGMAFAAMLGLKKGMTPKRTVMRLLEVMSGYGLKTDWPVHPVDSLTRAVGADKKAIGSKIKFVFLRQVGQTCFRMIPPRELALQTKSLKGMIL